MRFASMLFLILTFAAMGCAQQPWPQEKPGQREQPVTNEDGGQSYLVLSTTVSLRGILKPGDDTIDDLQQHSIFLGNGWSDPAVRAREARLRNLLSNIREQAQFDEISRAGITNFNAPTSNVEKLDIIGDRKIADLEIQSILSQIIKDGPEPNAGSIYMIFLDPTLHSTLGPLVADKHFLAYHAFLNLGGVRVHYAVVPYQPKFETAYQVALRTLVVAALHSEDQPH